MYPEAFLAVAEQYQVGYEDSLLGGNRSGSSSSESNSTFSSLTHLPLLSCSHPELEQTSEKKGEKVIERKSMRSIQLFNDFYVMRSFSFK